MRNEIIPGHLKDQTSNALLGFNDSGEAQVKELPSAYSMLTVNNGEFFPAQFHVVNSLGQFDTIANNATQQESGALGLAEAGIPNKSFVRITIKVLGVMTLPTGEDEGFFASEERLWKKSNAGAWSLITTGANTKMDTPGNVTSYTQILLGGVPSTRLEMSATAIGKTFRVKKWTEFELITNP